MKTATPSRGTDCAASAPGGKPATPARPHVKGAAIGPVERALPDPPGGRAVLAITAALWAISLVRYLRHRIVVTFDSINNYVHVWYVADRIWKDGTLPLRMPVLGHGEAFAFPYGIVPWTSAALLRPALGDWVVTLWMAVGGVGLIVATFYAFPELRHGWWAAAVMLNPAVIEAPLFGQLSFAWAAAFLLVGIGLWRRDRRLAAALLVGLGQINHAAVVLPLAAFVVLAWLPFERNRRALVGWYALSVAMALPAAFVVLASPTSADASTRDVVVNFFGTVGARCPVIAIPMVLVAMQRHLMWRATASIALGLVLLVNAIVQRPLRVDYAWGSLTRSYRPVSMERFLASPEFRPGLTYRVLRNGDAKLGLYRLLQEGGRIDSEFFPESMAIHSFKSRTDYERLLCDRKVDEVVAFHIYDTTRHTNEHAMLREVAAQPGPVGVKLVGTIANADEAEVYRVDRSGCSQLGRS